VPFDVDHLTVMEKPVQDGGGKSQVNMATTLIDLTSCVLKNSELNSSFTKRVNVGSVAICT